MIVEHADAILDALADMNDVPAYDSDKVPASPGFPYVVIYLDLGQWEAYRLSARSKLKVWRLALMVVGSSTYEARYAADEVQRVMTAARLTIAGRVCTPLREESSQPVEREDPDIPGIYTATSVWRFASTPAAA